MSELFIAVAENPLNKWRRCQGFDTIAGLDYHLGHICDRDNCRHVKSMPYPGIPTALLPLFVGPDTATEAAISMYRNMTLCVQDIMKLPHQLFVDSFHLGVNAAMATRNFKLKTGTFAIREKAANGRISYKKLRNITAMFSALLKIRNKSSSISFCIGGTAISADIEPILEAFGEVHASL
jgi:hypothetical protein